MFETLKRLYNEGRLPSAGLSNAVKKGWINEEQEKIIKGNKSE